MRFEMPDATAPITLQEVQNVFYYASDAEVVRWAAMREMIPRLDPPPRCCADMTLSFGTTSRDGAVWRCPNCRRHRSVRGDCWLRDAKLSLRQAAMLLAYWIDGRSLSNASADCSISPVTVGRFFEEFRLVAQGLYRNDIAVRPLGGVGRVCQIDESLFGKAKHHRGRALLTQVWVFGIVDAVTGRVMLEMVDQRDANTLLPIITTTVAPGSIIWSDMWRAYNQLEQLGFVHDTVNHSREFVSPSGTHTQIIEGVWALCKQFLRKRHAKSREHLEQYIHEWAFRRNLAPDFASAWHHLNS